MSHTNKLKIINSDSHQLHIFNYSARTYASDAFLECPQRAQSIFKALEQTFWAEFSSPHEYNLEPILQVHTLAYLEYLQHAYETWQALSDEPGVAFIPYSPKIDMATATRGQIPDQNGFFSTDLHVPINAHTWQAALAASQMALTAAQHITEKEPVAFALCRPPGHHAGREICGGFCYLNNAAIAANWLSRLGKVALLDIDFHAGNGTQAIFYERPDVFTLSLHADPAREYPSYAGFADEIGAGKGKGFHRNFPLPAHTSDDIYLKTLEQALDLVSRYGADFLVLSAGFDTYKEDHLGDFDITNDGFSRIGTLIASLNLPTAIILEGGYHLDSLGENVRSLLEPFVMT